MSEIVNDGIKKTLQIDGKKEYKWITATDKKSLKKEYLKIIPVVRSVARKYGFAIGVHGSLERDCDLIAVQWKSKTRSQKKMIKEIQLAISSCYESNPKTVKRPHGRTAYIIHIGTHAYIDLSIVEN